MVVNDASLKRNGVQDFVSLRATAIILASYAIFIVGFLVLTPQVTFEIWKGLFSGMGVKIFTLLAILSMMIHVRIGLWQVLTDYIKSAMLRAVLQFILNVVVFAYVATGLFVLWGV
ncbi:succinate dehydrogenase, hydrophobic membrane anchor protein [Algicola sagamiensis]|uniref:succinate dehydrogenase, hydrophobic membrane anchor protein n=1 Tax=Algicola sagamiensis TaxID=163869 RepID=UPI0003829264|nr:succinate dehydrogenase, hydrophobic membrane anchor protein [Algicola sagamiensis]